MEEEDKVFVSGEIISISSRFWDGWGFAKVLSGGKEVKITGALEGFSVGTRVSVNGVWKQSEKYGAQINVVSIVAEDPTDKRGIELWLCDRLPQIGEKRSAALAKKFGPKLWDVIQNDPSELTCIPGITQERAQEIHDAYELYAEEREHYVAFYNIGLLRREAKDLYDKGIGIDRFMQDPFEAYFLSSFSFIRLEKIRKEAGVGKKTKARMKAAVIEALRSYAADGHTAVPMQQVLSDASDIGGYGDTYMGNIVQEMLGTEELRLYEGEVMLPQYDDAESCIAEKIVELMEIKHG